MNRMLIIYFLCLVSTVDQKAQTFSKNPFNENYYKYQTLAIEHYNKKEFLQAAQEYSNAFYSNNGMAMTDDRYKQAGCWAMAGEKDSAFKQLFTLIGARYQKYNDVVLNADLKNLHKDKRWAEFLNAIKNNRIKYNPQLDIALTESLDAILQNDQRYRQAYMEIEVKHGQSSNEMKELKKIMAANDSINFMKVQTILNSQGWPTQDVAGPESGTTIFLVIQHSDLSTQEKFLPHVKDAVKTKKIPPSYLALLEDRMAVDRGKKQKYGSQVGKDKNGNYYLEPLEDPQGVDLRRAEIGLGPLADYLKQWNIEWPEKKKK